MSVEIVQGDCREVLQMLEPDSFAACCTDPPYHLIQSSRNGSARPPGPGPYGRHREGNKGFMGKLWDGGDVAFRPETWAAVLRVLKPGAYCCAFASSRDFDMTAAAMRAAGFIMHPFIAWITGQGFPKATNFTDPFDEKLLGFTEEDDPKDWEMSRSHWATYWEGWRYGLQALKPAIEPILVGQKPFVEPTGRKNVLRWGTGALNIDASRVATGESTLRTSNAGTNGDGWGMGTNRHINGGDNGRWPANVAHDGSPEVLAAFARFGDVGGKWGSQGDTAGTSMFMGAHRHRAKASEAFIGDTGSAARFFFCAKADASERVGSHPTVKPVALMEWLVRMVTPPGGRVLDPFCGTGSTLVACDRLGFDALGIEQDAQTVKDAHEKIQRFRARRAIGDVAVRHEPLAGQLEIVL